MGATIQFLSYNKKKDIIDGVSFADFSQPQSLDSFEINIIDLNCPDIWYCDGTSADYVNCKKDLENIQTMIRHSKNTKIIVFLPQNYDYYYNRVQVLNRYEYRGFAELKNRTDIIKGLIEKSILPYITDYFPSVYYENTFTIVDGKEIPACFCFESYRFTALTLSEGSSKITTIEMEDKLLLSTLGFADAKHAASFVKRLFADKENTQIPEWMSSIDFGSDKEQTKIINDVKAEIASCNLRIGIAQAKLEKNAYYKSILYSSGKQLVEVVFDMLQRMLECDLSDFIDEKREDFRIKKPRVTFIGEIKGIGSNIKSENISQVDRHCAEYSDYLQENGEEEHLKQLLIINPFRLQPLEQREPIHETQLKLALRNECLLIKTEVLLRIFEAFQTGKLTSQQVERCFTENSGEFKLDMLD